MKVGVPRGLYYYRYFPFWESFLQGLGCTVVISDPTTKQTLDFGVAASVDGICLPVKVYIGHVQNLIEKNVDYLFIPYIISIEKGEYICPKFMGLPDIVRGCIKQTPPILSPTIDGRRGPRSIMWSYLKFGLKFAKFSQVLRAYRNGLYQLKLHEAKLLTAPVETEPHARLHIGVLGHEYLLNDDFISMGITKRLRQAGCKLTTVEHLDQNTINANNSFLKKRMYWSSGKQILGAAHYLAPKVDGIISLMSFACGTDSFTIDIVERYCRRNQIPHLLINLDEHTGQAGVLTRLDAFLDLLQRRKQREDYSPAFG
ncbi:MAG: hypothetical protein GX177_04395 [Firmicutes bacterium]|nr:hypothetical protein [Bacillota bacterium]